MASDATQMQSEKHDALASSTIRVDVGLLDKVMKPMGVTYSMVDMRDPSVVRAALRPETRLV